MVPEPAPRRRALSVIEPPPTRGAATELEPQPQPQSAQRCALHTRMFSGCARGARSGARGAERAGAEQRAALARDVDVAGARGRELRRERDASVGAPALDKQALRLGLGGGGSNGSGRCGCVVLLELLLLLAVVLAVVRTSRESNNGSDCSAHSSDRNRHQRSR